MKKILTLLCLAAFSLSFVSCSKKEVKESLSKQVSKALAKVIVAELECTQSDIVYSDVKVMTDKLFKVEAEKEQARKLVSAVKSSQMKAIDAKVMICRTVSNALMPTIIDLMKQGELKKWECKLEKGEAAIMDLVYKGCDKLAQVINSDPGTMVAMNISHYSNVIDRPPRPYLVSTH